jgi:hypothetical protein
MKPNVLKDIVIYVLSTPWRWLRSLLQGAIDHFGVFWPWLRWPLLLCGVVILSCSGWHMAFAKTGRVVEAGSGKPIAEAYVVASYWHSGRLYHGGYNNCVGGAITQTDRDGRYEIPGEAKFLIPSGVDGEFHWQLIVFKPGYVPEGGNQFKSVLRPQELFDEKTGLPVHNPNFMEDFFNWENPKPPGGAMLLDDVRLEPIHLSVNHALKYFWKVSALSTSCAHADWQAMKPMRRVLTTTAIERVCAASREEKIVTTVFLFFTLDR